MASKKQGYYLLYEPFLLYLSWCLDSCAKTDFASFEDLIENQV